MQFSHSYTCITSLLNLHLLSHFHPSMSSPGMAGMAPCVTWQLLTSYLFYNYHLWYLLFLKCGCWFNPSMLIVVLSGPRSMYLYRVPKDISLTGEISVTGLALVALMIAEHPLAKSIRNCEEQDLVLFLFWNGYLKCLKATQLRLRAERIWTCNFIKTQGWSI